MVKVGYLWRAVPMCATKKLFHATDLMWGRRKSKRARKHKGDRGKEGMGEREMWGGWNLLCAAHVAPVGMPDC